MGRQTLTILSFLAGMALPILITLAGCAAGRASALETVAFEDVSSGPACCAVPMDVVARAVEKEGQGIVNISVDEAAGRLTITFDPQRISRARVVALLKEFSFRPIDQRR